MRTRSTWAVWRGAGAVLLAGALLTTGCDRGDQPKQLGTTAPVFALNDGQESVDLRSLRGQVVVLNFWATWCAPCLQELPSLEALQDTVPQIKIIGVSIDEDPTAYLRFVQRHPTNFLTVRDGQGRSNALYGTFRPPETYVIDRAGVIRRKFIGPQDWTSPEIVNTLRKLAG